MATMIEEQLPALNRQLEALDIAGRFEFIRSHFKGSVVASTSAGAQATVMLHLLAKHAPEIPVIFVDTGYHFPETYQFLDDLQKRFELDLRIYTPEVTPARQEALFGKLWEQGEEGLKRYGLLNKVEPMNRALQEIGASAWISGVRKSQSRDRSKFDFIMKQSETFKIYPIIDWSDEDIENYRFLYSLPIHPLVEKGYVSIGDWHSSKPLEEGMSPEDTRFGGVKRECGMHEASNVGDYQI